MYDRFFRNVDAEITECVGFVLPTSDEACPILCVTLQWEDEDLIFVSKLSYCDPSDFLCDAIKKQKVMAMKYSRKNYVPHFLKLSESCLSNRFGENSKQVPSGQSIVVTNDTLVYKLIVSPEVYMAYQRTIGKIKRKQVQTEYLSLPLTQEKDFFVYERLIYPLTREEARTCLKDFIKKNICCHTVIA